MKDQKSARAESTHSKVYKMSKNKYHADVILGLVMFEELPAFYLSSKDFITACIMEFKSHG